MPDRKIERKIRLLFVIGQFTQGGSERYLFELCKALDKDKFQIEILTKTNIQRTDYYYSRIEALGIPIHRKLPRMLYLRERVPHLRKMRFFQALMTRLYPLIGLRRLFRRFDLINIIQIENYYILQHFFKDNSKLLIYLMSGRYQYNYDVYTECLPGRKYRFLLMDPAQREEIKGSHCENAATLYFPLALDLTGREKVALPPADLPLIKIGIFVRLSPERPIEPLFHGFAGLSKELNLTLHVYGRGDPKQFDRVLDELQIRDKVFFEGHQPNIEETLKRDNLSLVWLTSLGPIVGYGSVEVASFGLPMVFWNSTSGSHQEVLEQTGGAIHTFTDVAEFIEFNREVLLHREKLEALGQNLRHYIHAQYDINNHIGTLEKYFVDVADGITKRNGQKRQ